MSNRKVEALQFNGETIYVEVTEIEQEAENGYEPTSAASKLVTAGEQVRKTVESLATTIHGAVDKLKPAEWTLEINLGFKGKAGIPFVTEGEANGAVKITVKWKWGVDHRIGHVASRSGRPLIDALRGIW